MTTVRLHAAARTELAAIFLDVFQFEGPITWHTSPDDVARWDSLQHLALVRALEESFHVALSLDEIMELQTVGAIETVLARHGV